MKAINFLFLFFLFVSPVQACSVCFGDPEALMTKGLNWGIAILLAVILSVLAAFAVFFLKLRKRLIHKH